MKEILNQQDTDGKRGKWIVKFQEYDLHITPTKLINGQELARLLTDSNCKVLGINTLYINLVPIPRQITDLNQVQTKDFIKKQFLDSCWYKDMVCYLHNLDCPTHLNKSQDKSLKLKYIGYCILNNKLFLKDPLGVLLNCVVENEIERIFNYLHKGYCGGHYSWRIKTHKILRSRFY